MSTEPLDGLAGLAIDVMDALGGPGAALLVAIDNVFPPMPSELVLPLAGFAASTGTMTLAGALLWTTLGSVAGALIVYCLGALLGPDRARALMIRIPLVTAADVDRTERWFHRHGTKAVFFGRMVPIFRSLISLPAGVHRMRLWRFLILTTAGSLIWNSAFVIAGYTLGRNWHLVDRYASVAQWVVLALVAVAIVIFVVSRMANARQGRRQEGDQHSRQRVRG